MKKFLFYVMSFVLIVAGFFTNAKIVLAVSSDTIWAKTLTSQPSSTFFRDNAIGTDGSVYAIGVVEGSGEYSFGSGVTITNEHNGRSSFLIKHNSDGIPQWAKTPSTVPSNLEFWSISVDSNSNIYITGSISGTDPYNFGNGITLTNGCYNKSGFVIEYNSSGIAQWIQAAIPSPGGTRSGTEFNGVSTDATGNVYVVGSIYGGYEYDFGHGVNVSVVSNNYANNLIVKYNSSGIAQWARTATVIPGNSKFINIATDSSGNSYTVGSIFGTSEYSFGEGATVSGGNSSINALIVKYNSSGIAQWARTATTAPGYSSFPAVSVDSSGVYVSGQISGNGMFDFGGSAQVTPGVNSTNGVVIKYNNSGLAIWGKTTVISPGFSTFYDISVDSSGSIYVVGEADNIGSYDFGGEANVDVVTDNGNALIVKFNNDGIGQWAKSNPVAPNYSYFSGVSTDTSGNIYAVGEIDGTAGFSFGNEVTVTGLGSSSIVIVKYEGDPVAEVTTGDDSVAEVTTGSSKSDKTPPVFTKLPNGLVINFVDGQVITTNPYTIQVKPVDNRGIGKVEFYIDDNLICTDTQADTNGVYSCDWDTTKYHSIVNIVKIIAYDTKGHTATLTREATVQGATDMTTVAELPQTGADLGQWFFQFLLNFKSSASVVLR